MKPKKGWGGAHIWDSGGKKSWTTLEKGKHGTAASLEGGKEVREKERLRGKCKE